MFILVGKLSETVTCMCTLD